MESYQDSQVMDTSASDTDMPETGISPDLEVPCDQVDNDSDGLTDEGSGDIDQDCESDCVDIVCQSSEVLAVELGIFTSCDVEYEAPIDPWDIKELWSLVIGEGEEGRVRAVIDTDSDAVAEVAISIRPITGPVLFDGRNGTEIWNANKFDPDSPISVGDVDSDGEAEMVGIDEDGRVCALDLSGNVEWCSFKGVGGDEFWGTDSAFESVRISDLDGDGEVEVVSEYAILKGSTGEVLKYLERDYYSSPYTEVAVVDLDNDGFQEIVTNWRVYNSSGDTIYTLESPSLEGEAVVPIPIQLDADPDAEIIWIGMNEIIATEPDGYEIGRELFTSSRDWTLPLASCAGDITGDGSMEFFTSDQYYLYAWTAELQLLWQFPIREDTGGALGCSVFDFDLDGRKEILFSDISSAYILSGTGDIIFEETDWDSVTIYEIPMVVDLDGDGSVEVIFSTYPREDSSPFVRVYSHASGEWPPGTGFWPDDTWSGTSVWPDGSVPRQPEPPWLQYGVWRGQPESMVVGRDLVPQIVDSCVSSCWEDVGTVSLSVSVENRGPQEAPVGTTLMVYGLDEIGELQPLELLTLSDPLAAGWSSNSMQITVDRAQAIRGLRFVAGDDGTGVLPDDDCDPTNNTVDWAQDLCNIE